MAHLTVPAKANIEGPWLIGQQEIEELDAILEFINRKLSDSLRTEINETVRTENEKEYLSEETINTKIDAASQRFSFQKNKKEVIISSKNEKKLSDTSLRSILKDPKIIDFTPKEIIINLDHGNNNTFKLKISAFSRGKLQYQIACFDNDIENEIRFEIEKWIDKYTPKKVLQLWSNHGETLRFLLGGTIIISLLLLFPTSRGSFREQIKNETYDLLKKGITKDNEGKALELILTHESNYMPDNSVGTTVENQDLKLKLLIISTILFIFSTVRPRTTIGIAKQKNQFLFYKFWIKFVTITIPIIFILNPIIDFIKSKI